jgi:hypothetical protein
MLGTLQCCTLRAAYDLTMHQAMLRQWMGPRLHCMQFNKANQLSKHKAPLTFVSTHCTNLQPHSAWIRSVKKPWIVQRVTEPSAAGYTQVSLRVTIMLRLRCPRKGHQNLP